ncbi:MAG TPA: hypothetical protein VIK83_00295, partial [Coriobacteriia bacterium]
MPLTIVAGLPGAGIGTYIYDTVASAALSGSEALVATHRDVDAARARAAMAARAPVGVRIATLDGVIESQWSVRGDGRRLIRGLARDVLLSRALVAAGVSDEPGRGLIALLGTIADRARGPIGPFGGAAGLPGQLIRAVEAYRELARGHNMLTRTEACRVLEASPPPAAVIAVDGFRTLHPDHEELLLAWAAAGSEVIVVLQWLPGIAGTESATDLVDRLRDAGARIELLEESGTIRPAELGRASRGLFAGPEPVTGSGAVTLAVAEGREAEARFIARSVASLIAAGAAPERIAVVFADPARHEAWLRPAFADEGVPAAFSGNMGVGETPMGMALNGLRSCAAGELAREDLSALIRSPFAGVAAAEADAVDLEWRRSGSSHGRFLLRRSGALASLIDETRALQGRRIDTAVARKWKKLADRMIANAYQGAAPVPGTDGTADAAVHRAFCRHLQEALELGDGEVGADEFWARFADARVSSGAEGTTDRVAVTSIEDVALEDLAHVIIGGLTASECPKRGSEDRLEGDAVARAMNMLGASVDPGEHLREERRSFFLAVAAAGESLMLTRCGTDDEGSPLRESVFWDEFLDLYRAPGDALDPLAFPRLERVGADTARP